MLRYLTIVCALVLAPSLSAADSPASALVRIVSTSQEPDYRQPWLAGRIGGGSGSGFVIDGERILTNAHVVSNARYLAVSRDGDPALYPARVAYVAHDCDLALLTVPDPDFFRGVKPLELGGVPEMESTVSVYGFPIGGDRLSITQGVVSRIDFQPYAHSGLDAHLTIQIDAAINPGNSGGPVLQDGRVVGVAFQGFSGDVAQNVGYMIPTPVVRRFLTDVADGAYDRYMDIALSYHPLHNPAMRAALGLPDDDRGVYVGKVHAGGSSEGLIFPGDVLLAIDGLEIASDGMVTLDGQRVEMAEVVERKFKGDVVRFRVLRGGEPIDVEVPLDKPWPFSMQANAYDVAPRFLVFGGLVFQPLDANFMSAYEPDDLRLNYHFDQFINHDLHLERPEVVVLSGVLSDPINTYATDARFGIVDTVNGQKIRDLAGLAAAIDSAGDPVVIEMLGPGRPVVIPREAADAARERIMTRYGLRTERNL